MITLNNKILIVGAGFSGAVIARELADYGLKVHIIDKRNHIGGNAYDYLNEVGIRIHKYGPHLFHTSNKKVFDFLSRFTEWVEYKHKVKAMLEDGTLLTLPVNLETINYVGRENILNIFIRPYSEKMWGLPLEQISPDIINRVPLRDDYNELYFPDDEYQYLPKDGYTNMFNNILNHQNITISLNKEYDKNKVNNIDHIFFSGPIDEFYDYKYGELPYRSIKFTHLNLPLPKYSNFVQINFTNFSNFTRFVEWKNLPNSEANNLQNTTLTFEEPCDYKMNNKERYYPVKDHYGINRNIYNKYYNIKNDKVTFIGRLGLYSYLDMHQVINSSLNIAKNYITQISK